MHTIFCELSGPKARGAALATGELELAGRHTVHDGHVVALCFGMDLRIER